MQSQADAALLKANSLGLIQRVGELSKTMTADEVVKELGGALDKNEVRIVRHELGIEPLGDIGIGPGGGGRAAPAAPAAEVVAAAPAAPVAPGSKGKAKVKQRRRRPRRRQPRAQGSLPSKPSDADKPKRRSRKPLCSPATVCIPTWEIV
jgi:hypothetical protein